jgi:hypothetical protein
MVTVFITFGLILFVVFIMSIGVIFGRKPISGGSCGGCEGLKDDCAAGCEKYEKNGPPPQCSQT